MDLGADRNGPSWAGSSGRPGEAAPNSVESEGRFRLSTILSHLSFGVHRNLVSEFGFQHPEVLVALDAPEVLLRLQEG